MILYIILNNFSGEYVMGNLFQFRIINFVRVLDIQLYKIASKC